MALFIKQSHQSWTSYKFMISHIGEKLFYGQEPVYDDFNSDCLLLEKVYIVNLVS